jgi:uncharacterized protein
LRLVVQRSSLDGVIPLKGMPRLAELVHELNGDASVQLEFGVDEFGRKTMAGRISAEVQMRCERCLGEVVVALESDVNVGLVRTENEAKELPEDLEPLVLVKDEPVSLSELVEDELILSLPIAPRHDSKVGCINLDEYKVEEPQEEKKNPFAALAALKEKH